MPLRNPRNRPIAAGIAVRRPRTRRLPTASFLNGQVEAAVKLVGRLAANLVVAHVDRGPPPGLGAKNWASAVDPISSRMAFDPQARLGRRFEVRAIHVGDRLQTKGVEPRLTSHPPVGIEVGPNGLAILVRFGVVVLFNVEEGAQERFLADVTDLVQGRTSRPELERTWVRLGDADSVESDAIVLRECSLEKLQVIAEILAKSVVLARYEADVAEAFTKVEPLAHAMQVSPARLPWRQKDLVKMIAEVMLAEQSLVGRAELLEKPDLLWEHSNLDRLYARLEDEYELRERYYAMDAKLSVISKTAQTMLHLAQTRRSLRVEQYIAALIVFEILITLAELAAKHL